MDENSKISKSNPSHLLATSLGRMTNEFFTNYTNDLVRNNLA